MKIKTLKMSKKKTENYQSRGAEVEIEIGPGDTYWDAVHVGNVLLAVALGEAPAAWEVAVKALLEKAHTVDLVEAAVTTPPAQPPKRRGRPPKNTQPQAGK